MTRHTRVYKAPPSTALRRGMDGLDILRKQRQIKDFDWPAWQAAKDRIKRNSYENEEQQMSDLVVVQDGDTKLETTGIQNKAAMIKAVRTAYNDKPDHIIMATALVCWELRLSPNPSLGHVWIFPNKKGGHIVMIGVYGLINLARRDHEFLLRTPRDFTEEERMAHELTKGDVGIVYPVVDMRQARAAHELKAMGFGLSIEDVTYNGIGIWQRGGRVLQGKDGPYTTKDDNIWQTGTARLVAQKRALAHALRQLGLNSGVGMLPDLSKDIPGASYSQDMGAYVFDDTQPIETEGEFDHQAADLRAAYEEQIQGEYHAD